MVFKFNICVTHHSGKTSNDFGVKRLKVKVTTEDSLHLPTNSFPDDKSCLDQSIVQTSHIYITHCLRKTQIDLGV